MNRHLRAMLLGSTAACCGLRLALRTMMSAPSVKPKTFSRLAQFTIEQVSTLGVRVELFANFASAVENRLHLQRTARPASGLPFRSPGG